MKVEEPSPVAAPGARAAEGPPRAMTADEPAAAAPAASVPAPGAELRAAREARGIDLDDLARDVNLARHVLVALEADDYERLPGPTFVRGYIRAVARQLRLDPEPLLDAFEAVAGRVVPVVKPSPRIANGRLGAMRAGRRPWIAGMGVGALVLVVVALALLFRPAFEQAVVARGEMADPAGPAPDALVLPVPQRDEAAPAGDQADAGFDEIRIGLEADAQRDAQSRAEEDLRGAAPRSPEPGSGADPDAGGQAIAGMAGDLPGNGRAGMDAPDVQAAAPVPSLAEPVRSGPDGALRVVAGGDDHLRFEFSGDCWVEVRDADDVAVYQDLNRAGQSLDLWGRAPFRIRLGYAPAVQLAYNDARVPLAPHTRNDIANLVIGR